MQKQNGFTLVELAIVLMIIGLLIGGVLRGQELMNNARVTRTVQDVKAIQGAIVTFTDQYNGLPGDMNVATARVPGCSAASNCVNGNGDGLIGPIDAPWGGGGLAIGTEQVQFWKHLASAHLMSGVDPTTNQMVVGKSHPQTPFGGGFTIVQSSQALAPGWMALYDGVILRMQGDVTNAPEATPVVSPHESALIDRKMDDGIPLSGDVRSTDNVNSGGNDPCEGPSYDEKMDRKLCALTFKVR